MEEASSTNTMKSSVGEFTLLLWHRTIELYPHLKEIDDFNFIHRVLLCTTAEAQDKVLDDFRNLRLRNA